MSEGIRILIASTDSQQIQEIRQRVQVAWPSVPVLIGAVEDGNRALAEFAANQHHVVIADEELPGIKGDVLMTELSKISGSVTVLKLSRGVKASRGDVIAVPILNWTDFIGSLQQRLPDEVKSRFGLFERNSKLLESLKVYGKKYQTSEHVELSRDNYFQMLPQYGKIENPIENRSASMVEEKKAIVQQMEVSDNLVQLFGIVVAFVAISIGCWMYPNENERIVISAAKWVSTIGAIILVFGFAVGLSLKKYFKSLS